MDRKQPSIITANMENDFHSLSYKSKLWNMFASYHFYFMIASQRKDIGLGNKRSLGRRR